MPRDIFSDGFSDVSQRLPRLLSRESIGLSRANRNIKKSTRLRPFYCSLYLITNPNLDRGHELIVYANDNLTLTREGCADKLTFSLRLPFFSDPVENFLSVIPPLMSI